MTNRDNDDLAAALAGLHGGDHHEPDEHGHDTSHGDHVHLDGVHEPPGAAAANAPTPAEAPAPPPTAAEFRTGTGSRSGAPRPTSPAPPASGASAPPPAQRNTRPAAPGATSRPAAPAGLPGAASGSPGAPPTPPAGAAAGAPRPPRPTGGGAPPSRRPATPSSQKGRPAAPARPAAPSAPTRPASPASPVRPTAPGADRGATVEQPPAPEHADPQVHVRDVAEQADAVAHVVEDDDAVNVPPPPMEYLGHTHPHHHAPGVTAGPAVPKYQKLGYRQTLIPILLTTGLCLFVLGATKWLCAPDTRLGAQPVWLAVAWFVMGGLSLLLGLLNMLQVKAALESARA